MTSLIVVRGHRDRLDPTYACISHDNYRGCYGVLTVEDGHIAKREIYEKHERTDLEKRMASYRGVVGDMRTDKGLMPLTFPTHTTQLDAASLRRAKSDDEFATMRGLTRVVNAGLDQSGERGFRSACTQQDATPAYRCTKHGKAFTEYRGGARDASGMTVELTRIVPHSQEWKDRMDRVYKGLEAASKLIAVGAKRVDIDNALMQHMDDTKDVVYGSAVHDVGYEPWENFEGADTVELYDSLACSASVGDGKHTALVIRSMHFMDEDLQKTRSLNVGNNKYEKYDEEDNEEDDEEENEVMKSVVKTPVPSPVLNEEPSEFRSTLGDALRASDVSRAKTMHSELAMAMRAA